VRNLETILDICQDSDVSVLLKGVHGIGKSQRAEAYAKNKGYHSEVLFLSHQETGDLIGIPYLESGSTVWSTPIWLQRMYQSEKSGRKCVLFLDELNRARLDVRQSALQLVLCKQIHQHVLPAGTLVIAAVNPDDDYQVAELDTALNDRFDVIELKPDTQEWIDWAKANSIEEVIISFVADNPDKLWFKTENELNHPTPRSWVKTSDFLKAAKSKNLEKEVRDSVFTAFLNGKIGRSVGTQFLAYLRERDDLNIERIEEFCKKIKNKKKKDIMKSVEKLKPQIDNVEIIKIQYIVQEMIKKYIPQTMDLTPEEGFEKSYPLMVLLYSLSLEVLHSVLKSIKEPENTKELYSALVRCDSFEDGQMRQKELIKRIVDKMNDGENK
jgi:hypothetical protein